MNWVDYIDRTYQQYKSSILTRLQTEMPEMTDHSDSNPLVKMVGVWSGLMENIQYYIDNMARELFSSSARLYSSLVKIATAQDYAIKSYVAASSDVTFTLSQVHTSDVIIPTDTELETANGVKFRTVNSCTIPVGEIYGTVSAIQIEYETGITVGTSDGTEHQEFVLSDKTINNNSIVINISSQQWVNKTTLGYSGDERHFVSTVNENKQVVVVFGDGVNGSIPLNGAAITADYQTTSGELGNVAANTITIINNYTPPSGITVSVTNQNAASGGSYTEDIESLRNSLKIAIRTNERAVTRQDYVDIAELYSGVSRASVFFNCGKEILLYVVPNGGGLASNTLLTNVEDYFEDKKMVTTKVSTKAAGEVVVDLSLDLKVLSGYDSATISNNVKDSLTNYISHNYQKIGGKLELGDVYETIETTDGVEYSRITKMNSIPYAHITEGSSVLDWTIETLATSNDTVKWKIVLTSATIFQLFKDNVFVGNFTIGNLVTQNEMQFTINSSSYTIGDQWIFYSYPYFGTIDLVEPSILISNDNDININIL